MNGLSPFRLRFGPLEWGWLETEIVVGDFRWSGSLSTSFGSPVNQWVHACHVLIDDALHLERSGVDALDMPSRAEVRHHHEPAGHVFTLTELRPFRPLPEARVRIEAALLEDILTRDGATAAPIKTWPAADFALLDVAREVCRAARSVLRRHGFACYHRHAMGGQEFPAGELLRLQTCLYPPEALATLPDEFSLLRADGFPPQDLPEP